MLEAHYGLNDIASIRNIFLFCYMAPMCMGNSSDYILFCIPWR